MYHGVLNVEKEKGYTSHDVVAKLRGITGQKKIGHTGTLDPDARGVLPVCFGKATKLCGFLTDHHKTYEAVLLLGVTTDTQDAGGKILDRREVSIEEGQLAEVIRSFIGPCEQIPPMYSAVRQNGKRLYALAREGITVERKPRSIVIDDIRILEIDLPRVRFEVDCSKGTYIRTLCEDIGKKAGCGGCLEQLTRTKAGRFVLEDSLRLDQVERLEKAGRLYQALVPTDAFFEEYPAIYVSGDREKLAHNGNAFAVERDLEEPKDGENIRVYDSGRQFVGIYRYEKEKGRYCPVKQFWERD